MSRSTDELIGKIYSSSTDPGSWLDLIEAITLHVQPQMTEDGEEIHQSSDSLSSLLHHLDIAACNNEYIHLLEDQKQALNIIYNNMPWPMLMLDGRMNVIDSNPAAKQFLDASAPISLLKNATLFFRDKSLKAKLMRVLNMELGRDIQILNSTDDSLSLLCTPLAKSDAKGAISQLRAVVWVISNDNKIIPSIDIIQSVFSLTLAEARLLHLLCKQGNLNQCAESLEVSVHTVRSQLKSIMAKTNVSSQVQLVSKTMGQAFLQAATKQLAVQQTEIEQRVKLPDGRMLTWFEYGDPQGKPVLSIEGLGGGLPDHLLHQSWYYSQHLRVINVIRPGHGLSTLKLDMRFSDIAADLQFLCGYLKITKPVMASYCIGGAYALSAAAINGELFERVGVLGVTVPIEYWDLTKLDWMHTLYLKMYRVEPRIFSIFARFALRGIRRSPEISIAKLSRILSKRDGELLSDPLVVKRFIERIHSRHYQGPEITINEYQWLQQSWCVDISKIDIPVLVWHGKDDPTISCDSAQSMSKDIPNAKFFGLEGHGRFLVHDVWRDFLLELLAL